MHCNVLTVWQRYTKFRLETAHVAKHHFRFCIALLFSPQNPYVCILAVGFLLCPPLD